MWPGDVHHTPQGRARAATRLFGRLGQLEKGLFDRLGDGQRGDPSAGARCPYLAVLDGEATGLHFFGESAGSKGNDRNLTRATEWRAGRQRGERGKRERRRVEREWMARGFHNLRMY